MTDGDKQSSPTNTSANAARPQRNWKASRVIGMVFASIGALIGLALLIGGVAVIIAYASGRDDGYFNTDRHTLNSSTYAITTEDIDLGAGELDWAPDKILGK